MRRTQAERSASTKAHILNTTFESLAEAGYGGTTTVRICESGAISRGALLHHYSTKDALLSATVEYVFERWLGALKEAVEALPGGVESRRMAIELLATQFSSKNYYVWLELSVAARTNPNLKAAISRVEQDFADRVQALNAMLFPDVVNTPDGDVLMTIASALLNGMAVSQLICEAPPQGLIASVLETLEPLVSSGALAAPASGA